MGTAAHCIALLRLKQKTTFEVLKPSGPTNLFGGNANYYGKETSNESASVNLVCMRERELYDKICVAWSKRTQLTTSFPQNI